MIDVNRRHFILSFFKYSMFKYLQPIHPLLLINHQSSLQKISNFTRYFQTIHSFKIKIPLISSYLHGLLMTIFIVHRRITKQHQKEYHPQRPNIRLKTIRLTTSHLRRHSISTPQNRILSNLILMSNLFRKSKISQLKYSIMNQYISRFKISMNYFITMQLCQSQNNLL